MSFLSKVKAGDLVNGRGLVESIQGAETVAAAVAKMDRFKVLSLPVTTRLVAKGSTETRVIFVGFISMWDVACAVWSRLAAAEEGKGEEAAVAQVFESTVKDLLKDAADKSMFSPMSFFYPSSVTLGHLLDSFSAQRGLHRVLLQTESHHHVVVSQTDAVRLLVNHAEKEQREGSASPVLLPLMLKSLRELGVHPSDVEKLLSSKPAANALRLMAERNVQAVAVVDDKDVLLATFSASDLRGLDAKTIISSLRLPAKDFLRLDASLQLTCNLDDSLLTVAARMVKNKVHRLWICDEAGKVTGVVSLADVLKQAKKLE